MYLPLPQVSYRPIAAVQHLLKSRGYCLSLLCNLLVNEFADRRQTGLGARPFTSRAHCQQAPGFTKS